MATYRSYQINEYRLYIFELCKYLREKFFKQLIIQFFFYWQVFAIYILVYVSYTITKGISTILNQFSLDEFLLNKSS